MKSNIIFRYLFVAASISFWLWFLMQSYRSYFYFDLPFEVMGGTNSYGRNSPGVFHTFAVISAIEFVIVYLIVRPHSYTKTSGWRPLIALVPLAPWTLLIMLGAMHQGSVYSLHMLWLLLNLLLIFLAVATYIYRFLSEINVPEG